MVDIKDTHTVVTVASHAYDATPAPRLLKTPNPRRSLRPSAEPKAARYDDGVPPDWSILQMEVFK